MMMMIIIIIIILMFKNNLVGKPWKEEESSKNTVAEANVPEKNFEMKTYVIVHY